MSGLNCQTIMYLMAGDTWILVFNILASDPGLDGLQMDLGSLEEKAEVFKKVCNVSNGEVFEKVRLNFKLLYVRECLISKTIDEKLARDLTTLINTNYIEVITYLLTTPQCSNAFVQSMRKRSKTALGIFKEIADVLKQQEPYIVSASSVRDHFTRFLHSYRILDMLVDIIGYVTSIIRDDGEKMLMISGEGEERTGGKDKVPSILVNEVEGGQVRQNEIGEELKEVDGKKEGKKKVKQKKGSLVVVCNLCYDVLASISSSHPWVFWMHATSESQKEKNLKFISFFFDQYDAEQSSYVRFQLTELFEMLLVQRSVFGMTDVHLEESQNFQRCLIRKFYPILIEKLKSGNYKNICLYLKMLLFFYKTSEIDLLVHIDEFGIFTRSLEGSQKVLNYLVAILSHSKSKEVAHLVVSILSEIVVSCSTDEEGILIDPINRLIAILTFAKTKGIIMNCLAHLFLLICKRGFVLVVFGLLEKNRECLLSKNLVSFSMHLFEFERLFEDPEMSLEKIVLRFSKRESTIAQPKRSIDFEMLECGLGPDLSLDLTAMNEEPIVASAIEGMVAEQTEEIQSNPQKQLKIN